MRVLLAEDEPRVAADVAAALERSGYAVDRVGDGEAAWFQGDTEDYDAVVLDLGLPKIDGLTVLKRWRSNGRRFPVLVLTARGTWTERVEGIDSGADDYLPKPFDFAELVARIRAVARRAAAPLPARLGHGDLSVDPARRVAVRAGRRLPLTRKELAVLECLLAAQGRPVSAEELLERVWDEAADPFTATVKTTVRRLRAKLGDPPVIETVRESGYRIGGP